MHPRFRSLPPTRQASTLRAQRERLRRAKDRYTVLHDILFNATRKGNTLSALDFERLQQGVRLHNERVNQLIKDDRELWAEPFQQRLGQPKPDRTAFDLHNLLHSQLAIRQLLDQLVEQQKLSARQVESILNHPNPEGKRR
ncbi:MAG: hypothetical protein Q7R47_03770 [Candidatus Diapherotrites archaeon]|nr:hypothetical protein [Candidatus Diapherotrites archaeon]